MSPNRGLIPRALPGRLTAALLTMLLILTGCGAQQGEDLSDLVAPLVTPAAEDVSDDLEALAPGRGTITISRERHGSYTSVRDFPVQVDLTEEATIEFLLQPDDAENFSTVEGTVTWSHSMEATESGDECTVVEKAEGSGTFETGSNGPYLALGMDADFNIDSNAYTLGAFAGPEETTDGDPNTHYNVSSTICSEELPLSEEGLAWWPFVADGGLVSGRLNEGSATLSGSHQEQVPPLSGEGPEITLTVTWTLRLP